MNTLLPTIPPSSCIKGAETLMHQRRTTLSLRGRPSSGSSVWPAEGLPQVDAPVGWCGREVAVRSTKRPGSLNQVYVLSKTEQRMANDLRAALQDPEVMKHRGMFVVVYKGSVVAVDKDPTKARREAARKTKRPSRELVIVAVPRPSSEGIPH